MELRSHLPTMEKRTMLYKLSPFVLLFGCGGEQSPPPPQAPKPANQSAPASAQPSGGPSMDFSVAESSNKHRHKPLVKIADVSVALAEAKTDVKGSVW